MASNPGIELESRVLPRWLNVVYVALFVPLLILIFRDRGVWPWDEAFYAAYAVSLFQTLQNSPLDWPSAMLHALGDRAPAISWLGQFFVGLVPTPLMPAHVQNFLLLTNWLAHLTAILMLYRILRKLFGPGWPAFLTCGIALASPLLTGLTYNFLVEPLQMWSVVWLLGIVAFQDRLTNSMIVLQVISAVAFGLLAKTSTPAFQMPLLLYAAYALFSKPAVPAAPKIWNDWRHTSVALIGTVLVVAGAAAWYQVNFQAAMQHVIQAASGSQSTYYGSKGALSVKLAYWLIELQRAFFWPPLLIVLAIMTPFAIRNRGKQHRPFDAADFLTILSAVWIAVILVLFARSINEDTRFLFGLLPYIGVLICWVATNLQSLPALAGIGVVTFMQYGLVSAQSYGLVQPRLNLSGYLRPYVRDNLSLRDAIFAARVTGDATPENGAVVGMELPKFNAVGLLFYGVATGHTFNGKWPYLGANWTEKDAEKTWRWLLSTHCKYYVYREGTPIDGYELFNPSSKAIFKKVSTGPEFRARNDKSNGRVLVFERVDHGRPRYTLFSAAMAATPGRAQGSVAPVSDGFQGVGPAPDVPFGLMELPKLASTAEHARTLLVFGWTAAPSTISRVEISLDGGMLRKANEVPRPDVAKAYPGTRSTGFSTYLDLSSVPEGLHKLKAVTFLASGVSREIARVPVLTHFGFSGVNPQDRLPFGLLEFPPMDTLISGKKDPAVAHGWAAGPAPITRVQLSLDGKIAANAELVKRPDVVTAYPKLSSTGFQAKLDLSGLSDGPHQISGVIFDADGASRAFAQIPFSVDSDFRRTTREGDLPLGSIETPNETTSVQGTEFLPITGWAAARANIRSIEVLLDGVRVDDAQMIARPDIMAAFPDFKCAGYNDWLNLSTTQPGKHILTVVVHAADGRSTAVGQVTFVQDVN